MKYNEYGDHEGPLMLLIHGGGVSGWMWDKQVSYFQNYHCIVPDLPEHNMGFTQNKFSIRDSAEELIRIINDKKQGKPVIVIGFSLGAQIVIEMLSMEPALIDYAMINSASVRPIRFFNTFIKPSLYMSYPLIQNRTFSKLQAKTLYIQDDQFETYYSYSLQIKLKSLIHILQESMTYTLPEGFSKAKGNILITVGAKERKMMHQSAQEIASSNPNCKSLILPNIGHGFSLAEPDQFNRLVDDWLNARGLEGEELL